MKKTVLIFVLVSVLSACTKDLTKLNVDPKNPALVPSYTLFTQGERVLTNNMTSSNVNLNIFRLIDQQWQETTYTDESNYNLNTRQIPDNVWEAMYVQSLSNLNQAKKLIPTDVADAKTQKNEVAITDILQVYGFYYLLTTFGNVPYSEAFNIQNTFPKFDDAATVYADLLKRLDADIAALDPTGGSFANADVIYGGDPAQWKKFANSFKLKMGITIADVSPALAQSTVESAVTSGVFQSNADNALFNYLSAPPNTNPIWVDLVQSGRQDFVGCSTMVNYLLAQTDPRLPYYFTTITSDPTSGYAGLDPGENGAFGDNSKPSGPLLVAGSVGQITNPNFPGLLLDYSETEFNLAEAVHRGYAVGGTEESHYNAAITASITYWGASAASAAAYLTQANVLFPTAGSATDKIHAIAFQKYLALYNRGWDAWIETRRLDYPVLNPPPPDLRQSDFPVRFTYPVNEENTNSVNYKQASQAIGGDVVTTKLWFDVN